jgi:hypothetical protein
MPRGILWSVIQYAVGFIVSSGVYCCLLWCVLLFAVVCHIVFSCLQLSILYFLSIFFSGLQYSIIVCCRIYYCQGVIYDSPRMECYSSLSEVSNFYCTMKLACLLEESVTVCHVEYSMLWRHAECNMVCNRKCYDLLECGLLSGMLIFYILRYNISSILIHNV